MLGVTAASYAAGTTGFVNGAITGAAMGASSGFILGTGNSLMYGENFGNSLVDGLTQGAIDGAIGGVTGGITGGIKAVYQGRNFWTGKYSSETLVRYSGLSARKHIPGSGHAVGSKRHKYASDLLKRYQGIVEDRQLEVNASMKYKGRMRYPDVVDLKNKIIFDWKYGYPTKTAFDLNQTNQMQMYREAWNFRSKIIKY